MKTFKRILFAISLVVVTLESQGQSKDPIASAILQVAAPYQTMLDDTQKKDVVLREKMDQFQKNARGILENRKLSDKQIQALMSKLTSKNEPVVRELFKKARIDEAKYQLEVTNAVRRIEMKTRQKYAMKYLGFLAFSWKKVPVAILPIKADKEITLSEPFPLVEERRAGDGTVETYPNTGGYSAHASAIFAGGFTNSAGLGHFVDIDSDYDRVFVSAALPETYYWASAFGELLGAAGASAKSRVEVLANNQIICQQSVEHVSVIAPALWYAQETGLQNVVVQCEFTAPPVGTEIVVRFMADSGVWAVGLATSLSSISARPRDIRVRLQH